jgi:hypothetical protein
MNKMRGEVLFSEQVRGLYKIEGDAALKASARRLGGLAPRECVKGALNGVWERR